MYVKVLDHSLNRAARFYAADPSQPVQTGRTQAESNPSEWHFNQVMEELKVGCDSMDRSCLMPDPAGYRDHGDKDKTPYWEISWVRFHKPGDLNVHLVCSTAPIYLMDESGSTIDRAGGSR